MRCEREKRAKISRMTSFERFVSERENLILNSLIYCEPMKRFQNRSDVMKFWSSGDGMRNRVDYKLKPVGLSSWEIEQKRVAIINFGVNKRSSNSTSSSVINHAPYTSEITNIEEARFGNRRDVLSIGKIFVDDDTKVTSRVNR